MTSMSLLSLSLSPPPPSAGERPREPSGAAPPEPQASSSTAAQVQSTPLCATLIAAHWHRMPASGRPQRSTSRKAGQGRAESAVPTNTRTQAAGAGRLCEPSTCSQEQNCGNAGRRACSEEERGGSISNYGAASGQQQGGRRQFDERMPGLVMCGGGAHRPRQ